MDQAWKAARREDLSEPLRYVAQRLCELLDPHAHFAAAASFTMDPVTATREFLALSRAHGSSAGKNPSHHVMLDGVERTRAALVADQNVDAWFGPLLRPAVFALDRCIDWQAAAAAGIGKKPWLMRETAAAARGAVRDLSSVMAHPLTGYRPRLVDRICAICGNPTLGTSAWLRFDRELRLIAAVALTEGRSETRLAHAVARGIASAPDTDQAVDRLRHALESRTAQFVVAFAIEGVRRPKHLRAFGLREVGRRDPRWVPGQSLDADPALAGFCAAQDNRRAVVATEVEAFDFEQAGNVAWQRGERVADQYSAEHRAYRISAAAPMLVMRLGDGDITELKTSGRPVSLAKPRMRRPEPRLEQSLRYAALARSERAPVVQVLHSWIALETLTRGDAAPAGPYQLLMHNLAPALSLHAVRQSLASTWHIASRANRTSRQSGRWMELERWLGIRNQHRNLPDLSRWVDLMRHEPALGTVVPTPLGDEASLDEAGTLLLEILPGMVPFAREAILRWRWRLAVGNRLSNWCDEIRVQAEAAIGRMYVMRNASVHTAVTEVAGGDQLAHAAKNIVDSVYEVLPPWLEPGKPTWRAFSHLERRAFHVHRTWNNLPMPASLDAENLTRPGGDGMTR